MRSLMFILDLLLNARESRSVLVSKILGCFFLMLAGSVGVFFLFQVLVPIVGYLESGIIACGLLGVLGTGFLLVGKKTKASPQEELAEKVLNFFKGFDLETFLKNNAFAVSLLSFGVGIILSRFKNIKSLSRIYKMLK